MKRPEPELTPAQLQAAWRHMRRPGWPATVEEALRDPILGPGLRGTARAFSREARPAPASTYRPPTPAGAPPLPATPSHAPGRRLARNGPRFDARRAAANDFDD